MAAFDNRYSVFVGGLKVALPLAALAVLSSLFLVPHGAERGAPVPFADVGTGGDAPAQAGRVGAPSYSGVTREGDAIRVTAESAAPRPGKSGGVAAEGVRARIEAPGRATEIRAGHGIIDAAAGWVDLAGGVTVTTSGGFRMTTPALRAALDRVAVASRGAVRGAGPPGRVTAGRMRLEGAGSGPPELIFEDGVTLRVAPRE